MIVKKIVWFCLSGATLVSAMVWAQEAAPREPSRLERQVLAFADADQANPPPVSPILLVGSSSFRRWRTAVEDLDNPDVLNRGFGGSRMSHVLQWYDLVVRPYDPRQVLVYEGDNDIWSGMEPEQVERDFRTFIERVRGDFPDAEILLLYVKPSPRRMSKRAEYEELNHRMRMLADHFEGVDVVDTWTPMLDERNEPREDLFVADRLHLSEKGYEVWSSLLRPLLRPRQEEPAADANKD